jgi:hypothetical protein
MNKRLVDGLSIRMLQVRNSHHWCEFHNNMPWNRLGRFDMIVWAKSTEAGAKPRRTGNERKRLRSRAANVWSISGANVEPVMSDTCSARSRIEPSAASMPARSVPGAPYRTSFMSISPHVSVERCQYVALPPLKSKTAAVVNEFSSETSQATIAATSSTSRNRARGILASMKSICSWVI